MPEELPVQCEDCLEMVPETDVEYVGCIAFCEECLEPTYSQESGLRL
jgi:formylmethanofuran dehydrogenase subunit E